ncbi:MAG: rhodanese-like domain-containing protein [Thermoflexales bacterium]|nr:rhodanese-like domain-containing protein [Thermoflexales bacterium]
MLSLLKSLIGGSAGITLSPAQYKAEFADARKPHVLIDVRTPEEFKSGHIPGAINIDVQVLPQRLEEIPRDKAVVLYCRSGNRSSYAAHLLRRAGYTDVYDLGGIGEWRAAGYPVR